MRYILATVASILAGALFGTTFSALTTPCEWEDSTNCVWIAPVQGNGQGTTFIDVLGITIPLP